MPEQSIKDQILKNLLQSIIQPLQEYIDILKETIIIINGSSLSSDTFITSIKTTLVNIKSLTQNCESLNNLNTIYQKMIEFLSNFDQMDEIYYIKLNKLIVKFNFFNDFFQSIKITTNIVTRLNNDEVNESIINDTKWLLQKNDKLLNNLYLESIALTEFIKENDDLVKLKLNDNSKLKIVQSNKFKKFLVDRKYKLNII